MQVVALFFVAAFGSSLDVAAIQAESPEPLDFNHELQTVGVCSCSTNDKSIAAQRDLRCTSHLCFFLGRECAHSTSAEDQSLHKFSVGTAWSSIIDQVQASTAAPAPEPAAYPPR